MDLHPFHGDLLDYTGRMLQGVQLRGLLKKGIAIHACYRILGVE